jgi:hypothetical protein
VQDLEVVDLDTGRALTVTKADGKVTAALELPIANDKQSAHLRLTGTIVDPAYTLENEQLVFTRTLKGLRNTVLLPAGWTVTSVSQSATIGTYERRTFLAFINLNAENEYVVRIRASRPPRPSAPL